MLTYHRDLVFDFLGGTLVACEQCAEEPEKLSTARQLNMVQETGFTPKQQPVGRYWAASIPEIPIDSVMFHRWKSKTMHKSI